MKPNIVLVVVDQMRSDCMGIVGNPIIETPYLDTLASQGGFHNVLLHDGYLHSYRSMSAGKSILPLLREQSHPWREYLHGEHTCNDLSNHWIATKNDKYVWSSRTGREQYFDLDNYPNELHNLISQESCRKRIECLRSLLSEAHGDLMSKYK